MTQDTKLDLKPGDLNTVISILKQHLTPIGSVVVYAFGSRATLKAKKYSDLDLIIEATSGAIPSSIMAMLAYDFEESLLPFKVDIVDSAELTDGFRAHISTDKKIIWQNPT